MEVVIKGASKVFGNCKVGNIVKELKKLKEKDLESLEATIRKLQQEVGELKVSLVLKEDQVQTYEALRLEALREIKEIIGHPGDVLNKVRLFNEYIDKDVKISMPKVFTIFHGYHRKMEAAMAEVRNLVSVTTGELSRVPPPVQKETPLKEKNLDEVRTPLPQRPGRYAVEEMLGEVPAADFSIPTPSELPVPEPSPVPVPELQPILEGCRRQRALPPLQGKQAFVSLRSLHRKSRS